MDVQFVAGHINIIEGSAGSASKTVGICDRNDPSGTWVQVPIRKDYGTSFWMQAQVLTSVGHQTDSIHGRVEIKRNLSAADGRCKWRGTNRNGNTSILIDDVHPALVTHPIQLATGWAKINGQYFLTTLQAGNGHRFFFIERLNRSILYEHIAVDQGKNIHIFCIKLLVKLFDFQGGEDCPIT